MPNSNLSSLLRHPIYPVRKKGFRAFLKNVSSSQTTMGINRWPFDKSSETINIYNPWYGQGPSLFLGLLNHSDIRKEKMKALATRFSWPFSCCWPALIRCSYLMISTCPKLLSLSRWLYPVSHLYIFACPLDLFPFPLSLSICFQMLSWQVKGTSLQAAGRKFF